MGSERIVALASYAAANAVPHLADAISTAPQNPDRVFPPSLINEAFKSARAGLRPKRLMGIMGQCGLCGDEWAQEAYSSAVKLCNESLVAAFQNRAVWDRRRTAGTRRHLLYSLAHDHIVRWAKDRGMDPGEVLRLRDEGGDA